MGGTSVGGRSGMSPGAAEAARRAEEARRRAEEARLAAEAARKAAEAAQAAQAQSQSRASAFEAPSRQSDYEKLLGHGPSAAPASSLLTEDVKDGQVNCLDVAADWVNKASPELRARSELVFLADQRPGAEGQSGHVVVRQGEKVFDPTTQKSYASMEDYKKAQPDYQEAGRLSANDARRILDAPPGSPERAAALAKAKVSPELQKMMVADGDKVPPSDLTFPLDPTPVTPEAAAKAKTAAEDKQGVSTKLLRQATDDEKKAKDAEGVCDKAQKKLTDAKLELANALDARKRLAERPVPRPGDAERAKLLDQKVKDARGKVDEATPLATQAAADAKKARDTADVSRHKAFEAANETVRAAKDANSKAARMGQPPPFPVADKVSDAFDAQGRLTPVEQTALLGAPSVVTPEGTARTDMQWMDAVVEPGNGNGLLGLDLQGARIRPEMDTPEAHDANRKKLADLLKANPDPAYQKEVLQLATPWLKAAIDCDIYRKDGGAAQMREFAEMAKGLAPENKKALVESLAAGAGSGSKLEASGNADFDLGLVKELQRTGRPNEAKHLSTSMAEKLEKTRERFNDAKDKVNSLNEQLAALTAGFGKSVTPEQLENAIATFKERHKEEYAELDMAAEGLSESMKLSSQLLAQPPESLPRTIPDLADEATKVAKELGAYARTDAGQKLFDEAVQAQAEGKPSALEGILNKVGSPEAVKTFGKDILGDMSKGATYAITKSVAGRALALAADTSGTEAEKAARKAQAEKLFKEVLTKNAPLFGVNNEGMQALQEPFQKLLSGEAGADEKFRAAIRGVELQSSGATDLNGLGSLRGLAFVAGVIGASKDGAGIAKEVTSGDAIDKSAMMGRLTKLLGDTTSTVGDGSTLVLDVLKTLKGNPDFASGPNAVLGKLGPIGGVLGSVGDAIGAFQGFSDGNILEGTGKSMTAVGGALLSAAALSNVVPLWGQVAGGALFAVGTGLNLYSSWKEGKVKKEDTKAFLEAAGVPPKLADKLGDTETAAKAGQFLGQLAERTKMSPVEMQKKLASLNDQQIGVLLTAIEKTKMDDKGYVNSDNDNGTYKTTATRVGPALSSLGSMDDAHNYLHLHGVIVDVDLSGNSSRPPSPSKTTTRPLHRQ